MVFFYPMNIIELISEADKLSKNEKGHLKVAFFYIERISTIFKRFGLISSTCLQAYSNGV